MANENSIDNAAAAFLADMGGDAPKAGGKAGGASDGPRETMFADQGMEGDDEDFEAGSEEDQGDEGDEELPSDEDGEGDESEGDDDQGDDEDGEGDDEDEDEGDDEGDEPGSLNLEQVVRVNIDGKEQEVSLQEALQGYVRTETFHQRLNLLNEAKNEIIREAGETAQARQKYIDGLEALQQQLQDITPREPTQAEWDALYAEDPAKARQQENAWRLFKSQKAELSAAAERAKAEQAEEHKKHLVNWVRGEQVKVMRAVPEWNDSTRREKEMTSMKRTAKAVGYSDEEISTLYDSRAILILRKAAAYDRMMAKKPKPVKTTVRQPNASGSGRPPQGQTGRKDVGRAMDNLRKTGSVEAAASVFGGILKSESQSRRKR